MSSNKVGDEFGEPHKFDPDFRGPIKKRSCTDILCCILFGVFLIGWAAVAILALVRGDPNRLLYPTDSRGQVCGKDEAVADKPFLFFFDLTRCASPKVPFTGCPTPQICVKNCPTENWFYTGDSAINATYCKEKVDVTSKSPLDLILDQDCAGYYVKSKSIARRCIPTRFKDVSNNLLEYIFNTLNKRRNITNDDKFDTIIDAVHHAGRFVKYEKLRTYDNVERIICKFARRCIPNLELAESAEFLKDSAGRVVSTVGKEKVSGTALSLSVKFLGSFLQSKELVDGVAEDIKNTWPILLIGCCLAMLISLVWIVLLRLIAKIMVWFSLFAFTGLSAFAAYYTMQKYLKSRENPDKQLMSNTTEQIFARAMGEAPPDRETLWLVAFIFTVTVFVLCFLILIFLRNRVRIAIALINEASKAVGSIMSTLFFPILPFVFHLMVLVVFCGTTFMLASAGNPQYRVMCNSHTGNCSCSPLPENSTCNPKVFRAPDCNNNEVSCQFYSHTTDRDIQYLHIYNVFMFLWTMFFVSAFAEFVLAGAFSSWYWSFDKKKDIPAMPVTKSIGVALRYHIGTIAFGSLIIAIVRGIRIIFEYIDYKVKQYNDSMVVKFLSCCCRCCLWCLEKFLRFINRNAYIYSAIYGTNFCTSARKSFSLLMRNILRVMTVDLVTDFLLLIGKLVVTGLMAILTFMVFGGTITGVKEHLPELNYFMTPVVLITIATFFIASSFFNVYEMAVDSLFFCFLEDGERNDGSPEKPYFMSKQLMQILDKSNKVRKSD